MHRPPTRRRSWLRTRATPLALVGMITLGAVACAEDRGDTADSPSAAASADPTPSVPDTIEWTTEQHYGPHPEQVYDVYAPKADDVPSPMGQTDARPATVFLHGGGWLTGGRGAYHDVAAGLAAVGWIAITADYRLAEAGIHPAAEQDAVALVDHVLGSADDLGIDPDVVVLGGDSAGGQLAALTAFSNHVDVAGVVAWSGAYDLLGLMETGGSPEAELVALQVAAHVGCQAPDRRDAACEATARVASPVHLASRDDPPTLLVHSEDDFVPLAQAQRMRDALQEVGVHVRLEVLDGSGHGLALLPASQDAFASFLQEVAASAGAAQSMPRAAP